MTTITIKPVNSVYIKVFCERGIAAEISEHFTFMVPNAKFNPKFKDKMWDGKIRLFNVNTRLIYRGLLGKIQEFAADREYTVVLDGITNSKNDFSQLEAEQFVASLKKPPHIKPRPDQIKGLRTAVREGRGLLLSPTGSGKSFLIYMITAYYRKRTLIIVPSIGLVSQMASDLAEYGIPSDALHLITAGVDKTIQAPITITTWQSILKQPQHWYDKFGLVIADEAHQYKAKAMTTIMHNTVNVEHKFGLTGTLDGIQVNSLVIEGLFGSITKLISTSELMDDGKLAKLKIKCVVLDWPAHVRKSHTKSTYQEEYSYLISNPHRNLFITKLVASNKGNTLVLFQRVEDHGDLLHDLLKEMCEDRVHYVHGKVDKDEREEIRQLVNNTTGQIILASYGTFSTGINIPNIDDIVFASPSKSKIRVLQSIGRGLRMSERKSSATLIDIADDLSWKSHQNYTLDHFAERVNMYNIEMFDYKLYNVKIGA